MTRSFGLTAEKRHHGHRPLRAIGTVPFWHFLGCSSRGVDRKRSFNLCRVSATLSPAKGDGVHRINISKEIDDSWFGRAEGEHGRAGILVF